MIFKTLSFLTPFFPGATSFGALIPHFFPGEGFGFNGNILETNIINLAVVIGVVVVFVGDALKSLLETRKETIKNNFQEANKRNLEAQEKLNQARVNLELAEKKAFQIIEQGSVTAEQEKKNGIQQAELDIAQFDEIKQETITVQQQKIMNQVSQQVVELALNQVRQKLNNRLDSNFHASVTTCSIALFTSYKPKR